MSTRGARAIASPVERGSMPSLKVIRGCTSRGTPAAAESGNASATRGGSTSGGPPEGGARRAQEKTRPNNNKPPTKPQIETTPPLEKNRTEAHSGARARDQKAEARATGS